MAKETKAPEAPEQELNLQELLAQLDAMKAEIQAVKAAQGDEEAAEKAERRAKILAERKATAESDDEYVEVKLFKDNGKYKDDVFVGCNGEGCLIKRGERVKIKRKFAKILDQSDLQDAATADLVDSKVKAFTDKAKAL